MRPTETAHLSVVLFVRGESPRPILFGYEYDRGDESDRRSQEREALRDELGGPFAKHKYPHDLDRGHLAVWRSVDRCVVGADGGDRVGSLQDGEVGPVLSDMQTCPQRFLPVPDELLRRYLTTNEDLINQEADSERVQVIERTIGAMGIDLDRFQRLREFVVREGRPFTAQPLPAEYPVREQGLCHWESLRLARSSGLVYAEGFALTYRAKVAVLHGWCIDGHGRVIDCTWPNRGIAYFGVPIHPEYARRKLEQFEGMPAGSVTASLLNDRIDRWAVLNGQARDWKLA